MMSKHKQVELLAPVGNYEKLEIAVHYGADAVYLANKEYSLRNFSGNFTIEELDKAVLYAHENNVNVYVACNIYPRNDEQDKITEYLQQLNEIKPDAVIISDPGILLQARQIIPHIPVHLSTQANTTNYMSVKFWEKQHVKRVNMARELSLNEIKEISRRCSIEIEAFVHGAMCISYSGRCLLSTFMTQRDSNRGMCSHPCRWKYSVVEEMRPGEYYPVAEDNRGTYVFNSKDLCMIEHLPEMIEAGIDSLKIEGRMKGIHYLASAVKTYRSAIDSYYADKENYAVEKKWLEELEWINNRSYCSGFYLNDPDQVIANINKEKPAYENLFVGKVINSCDKDFTEIEVRNKIFRDDTVMVLRKKGPLVKEVIEEIMDQDGEYVAYAQPGSRVKVKMNTNYNSNDLIRRI